jgi:hypothetical protein
LLIELIGAHTAQPAEQRDESESSAAPATPIRPSEKALGKQPAQSEHTPDQSDKRPSTADSGRGLSAKKPRSDGKWIEVNIGEAVRKGYAMPEALANSPLPGWVKDHLYKEGVRSRETNMEFNSN